jgi:hypothetical protein
MTTLETNALVIPSVHLNGTSRGMLYDQLRDGVTDINTAIETLNKASPHMRDYYVKPNSEEAYRLALAQHNSRIQRLIDVRTELETIFQAMDATVGELT